MSINILPITHSVLDAGAVAEVLGQHWEFTKTPHAELLTRGMNDVYLIRADGVQYACRAWRAGWRSEDDIAYEMGLLKHLDEAGLLVAEPVEGKEGIFYVPVEAPEGRRYLGLFRWADGSPYGDNPDVPTAKRFGAMFGVMHKLARNFAPKVRRQVDYIGHLREDSLALLKLAAHRPEDVDYYPKAVAAITAALAELPRDAETFGPGHGDIHLYNAFVTEDGTIRFLDFDNCGEDHYAQELMSFSWANDYVGIDNAVTQAFLEGYNSERPLTDQQSASIPLLYAAKQLRFLCGFSAHVNCVGHTPLLNPNLDWFAERVRKSVTDAGLM